MNTLFIVKIAYLSGQMLCMTSQPHTVPVQPLITKLGATLLSAEATNLEQDTFFSAQVVHKVPFIYNGVKFNISWGCYQAEIFPR